MKNFVIMPNAYKDPDCAVTRHVSQELLRIGGRVFVSETLKSKVDLSDIHYYDGKIPDEAEMILVIGGDGSVLDAAVDAIDADLPLLGINLGRLGYLAEMGLDEISELSRLISDDFVVQEHITFAVSLVRGGEEVSLARKAVNDVVISQGDGDGLSDILIDDGVGNHLSYLADGVIVATPLGSTAYSLAAGGPVIDASLHAICVTPICAHSLFSRSVLFPPEYTITLKNCSAREGTMRISIDGADSYTLAPGDYACVTRAAKPLRMIKLKNQSALGVLCRKMQLLNPKHERIEDNEK